MLRSKRGILDGRSPELLLLAVCVLWFLAEGWSRWPQADDAYISFRYAQNLAEGNGLVFNVGEYVEGFTNLSWTVLLAAGVLLGWQAPDVAHCFGLLSGVALLLATYFYVLARSAWQRSSIDAHVPGHSGSDADYVFARKPDYILIQRQGTGAIPIPALVDIWSHPELKRRYRWDRWMRAYRRLASSAK